MSRSVIYTVNQSIQTVPDGGAVSLGTIVRRYGCNLGLSGNAIVADGIGYYSIDASIVTTPTAAGNITATLFRNGVAIPGATATMSVSTVGNTVTLSIPTEIRECCSGQGIASITCVLTGQASNVSNVAIRVAKD